MPGTDGKTSGPDEESRKGLSADGLSLDLGATYASFLDSEAWQVDSVEPQRAGASEPDLVSSYTGEEILAVEGENSVLTARENAKSEDASPLPLLRIV